MRRGVLPSLDALASRSLRVFGSETRSRVALTGLWCAVLVTAGALWVLSSSAYQRAQDRLRIQARTYAHLIAAHDRFAFTMADVLLQGLGDQLAWSDLNGEMTPARRAQVEALLKRHADRLPGIASFAIVGADGVRRAGLAGADFVDLSRSGYFVAIRDGERTYVSNLEEDLASGKPGIHVARRFDGPQGEFGGVLVINLAVQDAFYPFYGRLRLGAGTSTALLDPSRQLLAFPPDGPPSASAATQRGVAQLFADGHRRALVSEMANGGERLIALERLEGSNVVATVSLPVAEALAGARAAVWTAVFGALASLLSGVAATLVILRVRLIANARDEALKSDGNKRRLIQKVDAAIEEERQSIAVEIHDELNATVLSVRLDSQRILALASRPLSEQAVEEIRQRAEATIALTRDLYSRGRAIVTRLRPEVLDTLGLGGAIEEMVHHLDEAGSGCRFTFTARGELSVPDPAISIAAYRIVQEVLSNVVKHAHATRADVTLAVGDDAATLHLLVEDNGVGFDPASAQGGIGLIGMNERVFAFAGTIDVRSAPGQGTRVEVVLPIARAEP